MLFAYLDDFEANSPMLSLLLLSSSTRITTLPSVSDLLNKPWPQGPSLLTSGSCHHIVAHRVRDSHYLSAVLARRFASNVVISRSRSFR